MAGEGPCTCLCVGGVERPTPGPSLKGVIELGGQGTPLLPRQGRTPAPPWLVGARPVNRGSGGPTPGPSLKGGESLKRR